MATAVNSRDEMRKPAKWMRPKDDRILEALRDEGNLSPLAISREGMYERVDTTRQYVSERAIYLRRYEMIEYVDDGIFRITDLGRAYLDEELDASTLDPIDE